MKYLVLNNFNHSFTVGVKGEYLGEKAINDLGGEISILIAKGLIQVEEEKKQAPKPEPKPEPKAEFKAPPEPKSKKSKGE